MEIQFVTLVLHVRQALDDRPLIELVADAHGQDHVVVFVAVTDTVDARHRGNDHHVAPLDQALGGRQAHLLDVVVDRAVLLDEQIARRHIGFWLVVVVVRNKILDGVFREKLLEFRVKLGGQASCSGPVPRPDAPYGR